MSARGIALVAVLWMTAALSLLAVGIASGVRADIRFAQMLDAGVQAAAIGDAAIQQAILDTKTRNDPPAGLARAHVSFDGHDVEVLIQPAGGYVNLNAAPEPLLQDLFIHGAGLAPDLAALLAARVVDWRDPDQDASPLGAENPAYIQGGSRYRTRGALLETPADLLQVLGVDLDIYDKIQNFVTIHGGSPGVDPLAASVGVLSILAHGEKDIALRIAELRDQGTPGIDTTRLVQAHLAPGNGTVFRMEARVTLAGRTWARVRWVDVGQPDVGGQPWLTLDVEAVRVIGDERGADAS